MHAVIIGAGIGGLAAGIALRNAGWQVTICERAQQIRSAGTGLIIWNNALKALQMLGLERAFRQISYATEGSLYSISGQPLIDAVQLPESMRSVSVVHRSELIKILADCLSADTIKLGAACTGYEQDQDHVRAQFTDGTRIEADLLVAADGLHSVLRRSIIDDRPVYAGYTAWRAVIHYDHDKISPGEFWGPHGRFGHVPMTEQRVLWFATQNAPAGQSAAHGEKQGVWRTFGSWHSSIASVIEATEDQDIIRTDIYDRTPIKRWLDGRTVLLGDSAHAMTPVLGQGACQAIEDAVVLGLCLQKFTNIHEALQQYQAIRSRRANFYVHYARIVGKLGQLRSGFFLRLRDFTLTSFCLADSQLKVLDRLNDLDLEELDQ